LGLELKNWVYDCVDEDDGHNKLNAISAIFLIKPDTFKTETEKEIDDISAQFDEIVASGYHDPEPDLLKQRWDEQVEEMRDKARKAAKEWDDDNG